MKSYEQKKENKCLQPLESVKKRKLTEIEILFAGGSGGEIRSERFVPSIDQPMQDVERGSKSRPCISYSKDNDINEDAFEEYLSLVNDCTKVAKSTTSADVMAESPSMIKKIRGLLHQSVKPEVDYEEATKDVANVLFMWKMNAAAGKRAFIPDIEDRDLCYNAVKIFSLNAQEALLIPDEFCQEFGDVGIDIYNDLIEIIGEQDKNCLPFVNMCLRTWLNHLIVDTDLLGDMSPFNFDKWVKEKMVLPVVHNHYAKTSYELMLAVFGNTTDRTGAMDTVSQIDHYDLPPSWSLSSSTPTNTTTQKGSTNLGKVVDTNNTALSERSSKLKMLVTELERGYSSLITYAIGNDQPKRQTTKSRQSWINQSSLPSIITP